MTQRQMAWRVLTLSCAAVAVALVVLVAAPGISSGQPAPRRSLLPTAYKRSIAPGPSVCPVALAGSELFQREGIGERPVVAQYYAWFDAATWRPTVVSDLPVQQYNSDDPATIARHVAEARSAGINALALSWFGPGNRTDVNLRKLLAAAAGAGLWITVTVETNGPLFETQEKIVDALRLVHDRYAFCANWLRYRGQPVVFFWQPVSVPVLAGQTPLAAWRSIRQQVDPDHRALWIAEGLYFDLLDVFDGQFGYSIAWSPNVQVTLSDWARRVRTRAAQLGQPKLFVGTVMPGYDDTRLAAQRPDAFARDREGGAYFATTWEAAIAASADWINVTSFNEWVEGSQIEPSVTYGDLYLRISKEWSERYKGFAP